MWRFLLTLALLAAPVVALADNARFGPPTPWQLVAMPHVATNAALAATANGSYPYGVIRDHYATGGAADGPLFFMPQTGTCAAASLVNDAGNCVDSTSGDGNSWKALHKDGIYDFREFGCAVGNSACDAATTAAAALVAKSTAILSTNGTLMLGDASNAVLPKARQQLLPRRTITSGTSDNMTTADYAVYWDSASAGPKIQSIPGCTSALDADTLEIGDERQSASIDNITITPTSGTIYNAASLTLTSDGAEVSLQCDSSTANWVIK